MTLGRSRGLPVFSVPFTILHLLLVAGAALATAAPALAQPGFSKSFSPATIGPGSTATLTFVIDNAENEVPVAELDFTDPLPAGMTIADFAAATNSCNGTLSAPESGSTIGFTDGTVAADASCTITVDVTSSTPGVHSNISGDLTSDAGNSGNTTADLTVATDRPGFSKSFSPSSVPLGGRSTLTFTIDNSANAAIELFLAFTDGLPPGMVVADPPATGTTCTNGVVTAVPGSGVVSLGGANSIAAATICTVTVDVRGTTGSPLGNTSGELTSFDGGPSTSSGRASAILDVTAAAIHLVKSFTDDPVPPGSTATLEFTINNFDRDEAATAITFTDDLDAVSSGLVAVGLPASDVCGIGSTLTGTGLLTLTGGNLPAEGSCTFSVVLQLPAAGDPGLFPNTTSAISADVGSSPTVGNSASDLLFVSAAPLLSKEFTDDPVGGGGTVDLEFTITNGSLAATVTDLAFTDPLPQVLVGAPVLPAPDFCGAGSTLVFSPPIDLPPPNDAIPAMITVSGASLAASASCTFAVTLDVIDGAPTGSYTNVTGPITGTVDGEAVEGGPASDDLVVFGGPSLLKEFVDDPADPGGTVTLEFTLTHEEVATADATAITFTDDLDAALSGLVATGLPINDVCGTGSILSGTATLSFTGGSLAPGSSCSFSTTLSVPAAAPAGPHTNTTSVVAADVDGIAVLGNPASDDLMISGLELSKEFIDDPVIPGETVTLRFTIDNISPVSDATAMFFDDVLDAVIPGMVAVAPLPTDPCGAGSTLTGTSTLQFRDGMLTAGTSCSFDVTVQVPTGIASDSYINTTTALFAIMEGGVLLFAPATDELVVDSNLLMLSKEFTDDPVAPGDTVTLEFTLTNLDASETAIDLALTDDLDATLAGLVATGLPTNDICGVGSTVAGTSFLTVTGGSLAGGASCQFSVTLAVPASVPLGTTATNTTSTVTGTISGLAVGGDPGSDDLLINFLSFSKSFDSPTTATGSVDLTFSITNESSGAVTGIGFSDDLDAVISGLAATGLPANDACGAGSTFSGSSFLTLNNGNLLPGASCSIVVTLDVPATATAGSFTNTTGDLLLDGLAVANPAVADLVIEPAPLFTKAFSPDVIPVGTVTTLTFTVDNSASSLAASVLDFSDSMPGAIVVADPANAATTCGGTVTAVVGKSDITFTGGTVAAGATCTVSVDVTSVALGIHTNLTGDLNSSSGTSGPATDDLEVIDVTPPQIVAVDSLPGTGDGALEECESAGSAISALLVTFDEAMFAPGNDTDPNSVTNRDNWLAVAAGPNRDIDTVACGPLAGDDLDANVEEITYDPGTLTATVGLRDVLSSSAFRLLACSGGLADSSLNSLDGDGDGNGNDDFLRTFRVDELDAFTNGNFDCTLDGWTLSATAGVAITHGDDDVDDAGISGSAFIDSSGPQSLGQCVDLLPDSLYELSGFARLNTAGVPLDFTRSCELFADTGCTGAAEPPVVFQDQIIDADVWFGFADPIDVAKTVSSALCQVTVSGDGSPYTANVDNVSMNLRATMVIFHDGFESNDTAAWSTTVP